MRRIAPSLGQRVVAEATGSALLAAIVVGSGIQAQRLSPTDTGLQLLENALATGAGLVALIAAFGSISGSHLNPVVSLVDRLAGRLPTRDALAYVTAQVLGCCVGVVVANLMFDLPAVTLSTHDRSGSGVWLGEIVATFGLIVVIVGVATSARPGYLPAAVGGYITAAYWFTSSTSFANPAITIARSLSDTFAGIAPASVPAFIAAEVVGGLAAFALVRYLHEPRRIDAALDEPTEHA